MKKALLIAAGCSLLGLTACSSSTEKFQADAEKFLKDNKDVETAVGGDVTEAKCAKPEKIEKGQTFTCVATTADGTSVEFIATVTGDKSYVVDRVQPGSTPVATLPAETTAPTSTG